MDERAEEKARRGRFSAMNLPLTFAARGSRLRPMTVASTEYLNWAISRYHDLRCDLATSGTPRIPAAEVGAPEGVDDFAAWGALAGFVAEREGWSADEVTAASGATGAMTIACAALLSPGDRALVERPAYEPLVHIPAAFGAAVDRFDRREEAGWMLEPAVGRAALRPGDRKSVV